MTRRHDLARLTAGEETGWYEHGRTAPWPQDFFAYSDWRPAGSEDSDRLEPF